jgi:hypothetical protein
MALGNITIQFLLKISLGLFISGSVASKGLYKDPSPFAWF